MTAKINSKWLAFSISFFLGICCVFYFLLRNVFEHKAAGSNPLTKGDTYFIPMKINGFSSGRIPYFIVKIENQTVCAKIDLGYEGHIALPSHIIKKLSAKKFLGSKPVYGIKGRIHQSDIYEVEKIHTESVSFYPVLIDEVSLDSQYDVNLIEEGKILESDVGKVGWRLFQSFNLLVDHKNSTLALCDSLETLKKQGYPVDFFIESPLLLDHGWIEFEVETGDGILRCVLDSGSTWNMLNKDLNDSCNGHMIFTPENADQYLTLNPENKSLLIFDPKDIQDVSVFNIGGKAFGPMTFNRIKSPIAIDAILGMEFFEDTLIYIDFSNRKIYFFEYPEKENISVSEHSTGKVVN